MKKVVLKEKPSSANLALKARKRMYGHMVILLVTVGIIGAMGVFLLNGNRTDAQVSDQSLARLSVAAAEAKAGFDRLKGRWVRPDGGYVIEIKEIEAQGKMVAAYFNPRPINVSQAEAALEGATIKVFIELRDTNYPGATYHLTYDPERDQLKGVYFQPALQQSFNVFFTRMK